MEALKEKTARGLFWGGMNNLVMQVIGVVFGIILARHLDNADYGMMAAIVVFTAIATVLKDSGFKTALVNESHPEDRDYNAVFWFNLFMGLILYAVLFFAAPLLKFYYSDASVVPLARYAFLAIIITSFSTSQNAWLFKNLRTKQIAKAGMTATLLSSLTGVTMAFAGCRYWALASQSLVFVLVNTILFWHYSPWRPTLRWDLSPIRHLYRFSWKVMVTSIATHLNNNLVNMLTFRHFGKTRAGHYFQAYQWDSKAFSLVQGMVDQVAQPVLVDLRSDAGRQLNALRKLVRFTSFVTFPLLLGLALVAHEFIMLTIGEKWLPSARLLQLLCLSGCVMPLCTLLSNLVISKGRSDLYMYATLSLCALQIVLLSTLWPQGLTIMVTAYVVLNIGWLFVWYGLVYRLTSYRLLSFLKDTLPFALTAAAVMALTWLLTRDIVQPWLLIALRIVLAAALYYVVLRLAGAHILRESMAFFLKRNRKEASK